MSKHFFYNLSKFSTLLAIGVVVLGAFVRLSDAGLGCPDWPGCYGQILVPEHQVDVAAANQAFPERVLEAPKAWKEMIHRYFAGALGILVLLLTIGALRNKQELPYKVSVFLLVLIIFQAALGMWTVTLLLKPIIVTAHLLGGMATLSCLFWLILKTRPGIAVLQINISRNIRKLAATAFIFVILQIALGGWTSSNYAALACYDFPTCQDTWLPAMDFKEGFMLWRGLGIDYEGGVLNGEARTAIHVTHRVGALICFIVIAWLSILLFLQGLTKFAMILTVTLLTQVTLGILNVVMSLPLGIATAHNGVAALLLLSILALNYYISPNRVSE